jgi:hypothetical protein
MGGDRPAWPNHHLSRNTPRRFNAFCCGYIEPCTNNLRYLSTEDDVSNGSVIDGHFDWATPDVRAPCRSWPLVFNALLSKKRAAIQRPQVGGSAPNDKCALTLEQINREGAVTLVTSAGTAPTPTTEEFPGPLVASPIANAYPRITRISKTRLRGSEVPLDRWPRYLGARGIRLAAANHALYLIGSA